jgi:dienelactone hydrolase
VPQSAPHRCIVIGHGVHYKSIDEPRLVRFSTELAKAGAVVLTPELAELADYRVTRSGAEVLGASVLELARRCPAHASSQVGLLGFSFAGGLALLAATEPDVSARLAYVASVGGYQDLSRVLSFLLTDVVSAPSGSVHRKAHEYGIVVLLYENLDSFVPEEDLPCMREAVRAWLHEDRAMAWALASERSTARSEELFMALVTGKNDQLREALRRVLSGETETLRSLSPVTRLGTIPVPVYLLHGTGDSVIPPEETRWGEKELDGRSHRALVTPLIEHVELDAHFRVMDAFDLVQFMAGLI